MKVRYKIALYFMTQVWIVLSAKWRDKLPGFGAGWDENASPPVPDRLRTRHRLQSRRYLGPLSREGSDFDVKLTILNVHPRLRRPQGLLPPCTHVSAWVHILVSPTPEGRTVVLGSTQPLTEMSTRDLPGAKRRLVGRADNLTTYMCRLSKVLEALTSSNLRSLSRPVQEQPFLPTPEEFEVTY
jgi:hypothetical protein